MTKEEMIKLAKQVDWQYANGESGYEDLWKFGKLVAEKEREACAKVLDDWKKHNWTFEDCAKAIRVRGQR